MKKLNTVILCSGGGSNMEVIAKACLSSELELNLISVITNNPNAFAIERAKSLGVRAEILPKGIEVRDKELQNILSRDKIELILLAGYLKMIPPDVIKMYENRILNIHPSLLPKHGGPGMYGIKVHEAVHKATENETGATVHIVTEQYDKGPIILQERVTIESTDTPQQIADRVLKLEHTLYVRAIKKYLESYAH